MTETWKTISEFPNYEASTFGSVRNHATKKVLKAKNDFAVAFSRDNVGFQKLLYELPFRPYSHETFRHTILQ